MKRHKVTIVSLCFVMFTLGMVPNVVAESTTTLSVDAVEMTQQKREIAGTVIDQNGEAMIGVSVVVKGKAGGTITNLDGHFAIQAAPTDVIELSFIGYVSQSVKVGDQRSLKVIMVEDSKQLQEVVVTGALGIRKQERKMGYAVTEVKAADLIRANAVNPISSLQGKVAGVNINIMSTSGVQASPSITIRGSKSLGNGTNKSQPIFVVDGIIMENTVSATEGEDWGSQMKNLNPDDYESMTVLKGAAATSLYGSRGANGAVVINTKSGSKRKGLGIDISQTIQFDNVYKNHIEMQDVYGMGYWGNYEGGFNEAGMVPWSSNNFGMKMEGQMVNVPWSTEKVAFLPQPDNWKTFYQTGHYSNTNVALNGGTDKVNYRLSYSFTDTEGALPKNAMSRHALSFKTAGQLNDIFRVDFGFNFTRSDVANPASQGRWRVGNFGKALTYSLPRNVNLADWKANYRNSDMSVKNYEYGNFGDVANIFHQMDYSDTQRTEDSYMANISLSAQILPWLDASAKANYSFYKTFTEVKEFGTGAKFAGGKFAQDGANSNNYNFLFSIHANKKFLRDRFEVDARVLSEIYGNGQGDKWWKSTDGGLVVPGFFSFNNSTNKIIPAASANHPNNQVIGIAGVLNFSWEDQVNLELTGRNDWLSTLLYPKSNPYGKNNFSVFYPSANLSWVATETFKKQLPDWFSFGKLRASISRVGYGTGTYDTNKTWGYTQGTTYDEDGNSVITGGVNGLNKLQNFDIKPEIQQEIELGFDARFVNDRFGIDFAWYKKNTYNQILEIPNTPESGASTRWINAGNIQNSGIEILVDLTPIQKKNFRWNMTFNYTKNKGKIIEFYDNVPEQQLMGGYEGVEVWAYEGGQFGVMTATNVRGKYQGYDSNGNKMDNANNGKYVVRMASDKKSIEYVYEGELYNRWRSDYDKVNETEAYKRTSLGSVEPKFFFGHTQTFRYKDFDAGFQIDGRVGGKLYSSSYLLGMSRGALKESLQYRDKASGGVDRVGSDGKTYDNGVIPNDVIFDQNTVVVSDKTGANVDLSGMSYQEAVDAGHIAPLHVGAYYQSVYGWNQNVESAVFDNTWVALREVTVGYTFPTLMTQKWGIQKLRLGFTARNLGYIYNGLKGGLNPESIQSSNSLTPVEYGASPYTRNFSFTLSLSL